MGNFQQHQMDLFLLFFFAVYVFGYSEVRRWESNLLLDISIPRLLEMKYQITSAARRFRREK